MVKQMSNRLKRIEKFKKFYDDSNNVFSRIAENDHSHKHLDDLFSLHVCPGGRMGGVNEKIIEVFYGARPIGKTTKIDPNFQISTKTESEDGAMLRYYLTDAGNVVCSLFPAKSENREMGGLLLTQPKTIMRQGQTPLPSSTNSDIHMIW